MEREVGASEASQQTIENHRIVFRKFMIKIKLHNLYCLFSTVNFPKCLQCLSDYLSFSRVYSNIEIYYTCMFRERCITYQVLMQHNK